MAMFSYNTTNVQPAAGFYHGSTSGFQFPHQCQPHGQLQNGTALTSLAQPTAFSNAITARGYQPHGTMQGQIGQYGGGKANGEEEDTLSIDSNSESKTPTQSDQPLTGHLQNRKRRRGVIEKRRRDRINNSLLELRRLVPTALEKQGSQKLEKAEILQMTVDHLRLLNSKGFDSLWRDQQRYATEYYAMGFRVCMSEVDSFLSKEGMDGQDPLRLRLISHLQSVGLQRQSAFSVWTSAASQSHQPPHNQYQPSYWSAINATASPAAPVQYPTYSVLPGQSEEAYSGQTNTSGQVDTASAFRNGFTSQSNTGNGVSFASALSSSLNTVNASGY